MRTMIFWVLLMVWGGAAWAQEPAAGAQRTQGEVYHLTRAVSNEVLSPFCPGKTLDMCTSPNAADVRRVIQDRAREGMSKAEIKAEILKTYGDEFRMVEPSTSDNLGLLVALLLGFILAVVAVMVLSKRGDDAPAQPEDYDDEEDWERDYLDDIRDEVDV